MATYSDLRQLFTDNDLGNKIDVAVIIAAEAIRVEDVGTTNHINRLLWAKAAFNNPKTVSEQMQMALLAANKDLEVGDAGTPGTILGATDAQIQAKVDAAVDVFADGS